MIKYFNKFHHIGVACRDINSHIKFLEDSFSVVSKSEIVFDKQQNASLCMLNIKEGPDIELVSGEVVKNLISKGISYYHSCYVVQNINKVVKDLENKREITLVSPPKPAILFDNQLVAFFYTPIGLIELLEQR